MSDNLTLKKIFYFWLPLAATWLMMSVEGPFLSALIARLSEPKFNLAAYGVAFSFALIVEAPVIMMMSASVKLVRDYHSFLKLRNFTFTLNALITLIMILLIIPSVFYFITEELIGLPPQVSRLTHIATIILLPWPGAIGYRRFYQGILIRNNLTRRVAYGTIIRISSMGITAFLLFTFTDVEGVVVGAGALSAAVIMEALSSRLMCDQTLKKIRYQGNSDTQMPLSYRQISNFYYPLALTSLLTLGVQPLVTFFIGQSRMAIESLAVLPVINSFVFIFRSMGLSFQEVVIALIGDKKEGYAMLKKFAYILSLTIFIILVVIALTPLADIWFHDISGLSRELTDFSRIPLMLMVILPVLTVWINVQRAVLVDAQMTRQITTGTAIEFVMIIIVLFTAIEYFSLVGAVAAALSFIIGRLSANLYLSVPYSKALRI
ncbi:MAG: hypothetical protein Kow0098_02660 [Ignavibacteriaceae bacterium]